MTKLNLVVKDIAVLTDKEMEAVSGGGGTLGCSATCPNTCDSSNCNGTTGSGAGSGCKPTSKGCQCPTPREDA